MVTVRKTAKTVHDTVVSRGQDWGYLSNFTNGRNDIAQCNNIGTKTSAVNRPYPVVLSNFDFKIPTNAVILGITIIYQDRMISNSTDVDDTLFPQFGQTTFSVGNKHSIKGKAPTKNFMEQKLRIDNPNFSVAEVNSSNFAVTMQYSYNESNKNVGGIYVSYVEVEIEYDVPKYNVSITEPRHQGTATSWSTEDDPTVLSIGEECSTRVYFRTLNGMNGGMQTVRINFPINYKMLSVKPNTGELIVYEDQTYVDWVVSPPLDKRKDGKYNSVYCDIKFTPRAFSGTDMVSATCLSNGVKALYYVYVSTELNFDNDVFFVIPRLQRLTTIEETANITIQLAIDMPKVILEDHDSFPFILKLWSIDRQEYVPFNLMVENVNSPIVDVSHRDNYEMTHRHMESDKKTYIFAIRPLDWDKYDNKILTAVSMYFYDFQGDVGEYEFRLFLPHGSDFDDGQFTDDFHKYDMYSQSAYIEHEGYCIATCKAERWVVNTPNLASSDGIGYAFDCKTANGFQWKTRMEGTKCILEQRARHIGGLRLPKSHYEPKLKFSNKVNTGVYKNRAYYNKTGQWDHDLSLNIYLPKFHWRTLQEFVKMDKPVSIDTCPSCDDDDVLNHRGWVEIEDISGVERVNNWWYKGEIGVKRITDKYYGRASIIKGNRVCNTKIPYTFMNTVRNGEYYLGYFDLLGGGQLIYDKEEGIINQIIVPTGNDLHLRSKWASKDIDDYRFNWTCVQPSEPTDESNDYKYNSIVYTIINNLNGETVLTYTLYDFTTFSEVGEVVNTCKASCTVFDTNHNPMVLFTKSIRLDYSQNNPMEFSSTTRLEFDANELTITEMGMNGQELIERNIILPSGEYLLDIAFCNNDVGLLEPDFIAYLNMDLKENVLANPLSNFYSEMLVSSFVLPNLKLLFYRYSDDGLLYYYYGDTTASYLVDGYQQYKGGVDLQTSNGASILYVDTYTQALFLSNGLCKIGFDRQFGTVSFYVYDYSVRKFIYVNMVRLNDWTEFDIISITDDKAVIQFGETIWSMWRGHPFVQCEHINTDLKINDEYDTINSESIITKDGDIIYDGTYGKKEVYLFNMMVSSNLSVHGTNSPNFISGDIVTLRCYLKDKYNDYIANNLYSNSETIGKVEFVINDKSSYIDPTPSADNRGRWYWEYTFTPPAKNEDYQAYCRFLPKGEFTESTSNAVRYTVRKIKTNLSVTGSNTAEYSSSLSSNTYNLTLTLKDETNNNLANQPIAVFCNGRKVGTVRTGTNGQAVYTHNLTGSEFLEFYGIYDGTTRYDLSKSATKTVTVVDSSKTDVTLTNASTVGSNGKVTLKFNGVSTGNVKVTINKEEHTFAMNSSKVVQLPKTGSWSYVAEYLGDSTHNKAILKGTITINKVSTTISLANPSASSINLGEKITFNITGSISNMPYTLYDNDSPVSSGTLTNGAKQIQYSPVYIGSHQFKVKYAGDTWNEGATSTVRTVTVQNTATTLVHSNDAIYQNTKDYVRLLDSNNRGIANKQIRYTVNGRTYNRTTDSNGYIGMDINLNGGQSYPVHIVFAGDDAYQTSTLDYVLQVKNYETQWKPAQSFHRIHEQRTAPYQIWNNLGFDGLNGTGYCTCGYSTNENQVIGTKSGTWNTPDRLSFSNFGFNIPSGAIIKEMKVRVYERQYDPRSSGFPSIGNAVITFQDHDPRTCSQPPLQSRTGYNINEVSWTNPKITAGQVNQSGFAVNLDHGKNNGVNTGALMLKYFEVGIVYAVQTTKR